MNRIIKLYQDIPLDTTGVIDDSSSAIESLGRFSPDTQSAAILSLAIGVLLMVLVWAWSRTKDENAFRRLLREQAEYVQKQLRKRDEELETERGKRHELEDTINEMQGQLDNCTHLVNRLKAVNGDDAIEIKDIDAISDTLGSQSNLPSPNDSGDVKDVGDLPALDFDELIENLPDTKPLPPLPRTRGQARNAGARNYFE